MHSLKKKYVLFKKCRIINVTLKNFDYNSNHSGKIYVV